MGTVIPPLPHPHVIRHAVLRVAADLRLPAQSIFRDAIGYNTMPSLIRRNPDDHNASLNYVNMGNLIQALQHRFGARFTATGYAMGTHGYVEVVDVQGFPKCELPPPFKKAAGDRNNHGDDAEEA